MAARDFDFLHGDWRVAHRRLRHRLVGSDDWATFAGTVRVRPILAGLGNFDENLIDLPGDRYEACTLRLYNPPRQSWSIHWIDGRDPKLDPLMIGQFADGIGTFFGEDRLDQTPIRVRFLWTRTSTPSPRWEQAFSLDRGATWETNWTMDFTREAS